MKQQPWILEPVKNKRPKKLRHMIQLGPRHANALRELSGARSFATVLRGLVGPSFPWRWESAAETAKAEMNVTLSLTLAETERIHEQRHSVQNYARLAIERAAGLPQNYGPPDLQWRKLPFLGVSFDPEMEAQWGELQRAFQLPQCEIAAEVGRRVCSAVVWDYGKPLNPRRTVCVAKRVFRWGYEWPEPTVRCFRAGLRALWNEAGFVIGSDGRVVEKDGRLQRK